MLWTALVYTASLSTRMEYLVPELEKPCCACSEFPQDLLSPKFLILARSRNCL